MQNPEPQQFTQNDQTFNDITQEVIKHLNIMSSIGNNTIQIKNST